MLAEQGKAVTVVKVVMVAMVPLDKMVGLLILMADKAATVVMVAMAEMVVKSVLQDMDYMNMVITFTGKGNSIMELTI